LLLRLYFYLRAKLGCRARPAKSLRSKPRKRKTKLDGRLRERHLTERYANLAQISYAQLTNSIVRRSIGR